jgi:hypothetical protein
MSDATQQPTTPAAPAAAKTTGITIDLAHAAALAVKHGRGAGIENLQDAMAVAKVLALSAQTVPPHCRGNPGICLGIVLAAAELNLSPTALANKTYVVNDRLAYESQAIHAIVERRAPLSQRLRPIYLGEGETRQCQVKGYLHGEEEPFIYTSPKLKDITPKNSPLWKTKPDLQLWYNAVRDWARMYVPDVILGMYTADELDGPPAAPAIGPPRTAAEAMQRATAPRTVVTQVAPPRPPVGVPGDSPAMTAWRSSIDAEAAAGRDVQTWPIPASLSEEEFEEAVTYREIVVAAAKAAKGDAAK